MYCDVTCDVTPEWRCVYHGVRGSIGLEIMKHVVNMCDIQSIVKGCVKPSGQKL